MRLYPFGKYMIQKNGYRNYSILYENGVLYESGFTSKASAEYFIKQGG